MSEPVPTNYDEWADMHHAPASPDIGDSPSEYTRGLVAYYIVQLKKISAGEEPVWLPTEASHTFEGYDYFAGRKYVGSISVENGTRAIAWDESNKALFDSSVEPLLAIEAVERLGPQ